MAQALGQAPIPAEQRRAAFDAGRARKLPAVDAGTSIVPENNSNRTMRTSVVTAASLLLLFAFTPGCTKQSEAAGRSGTSLALNDPSDQTLTQGGTNKISVSVDRRGFADAVQVSFSNLPMGVRVDEGSIPAGDSRQDFVLVAAPDAQVVTKHLVTVTVRGSGAAPSQTFELTVKPK